MKRTITLGFLALSAGTLFSACSTEPQTHASPHIETLAQALCGMSFRCCNAGEASYYLGPYVDADNCVGRLVEDATQSYSTSLDLGLSAGLREGVLFIPNLAALNQAIEEGRARVDEEAIAACQAYLEDAACNEPEEAVDPDVCVPLEPEAGETPCDLERLYIGQLLEGAECTSGTLSLECAPGLKCSTGLGLGTTGRCVPLRTEGETCSAGAGALAELGSSQCERGLYCSQLDATCQAPKKKGEVCVFADRNDESPDPQTLLTRCESHLSCDPISRTCVESCQAGAQCDENIHCDEEQDLLCIVGRCSKVREEGQPCEVQEHCSEGLRCGDDPQNPGNLACLPGLPLDVPCVVHTDCQSGFCDPDASRCRAQADVGQPCPSGEPEECAGGTCVAEKPGLSCLEETDCPLSGVCDISCGTYCIALKDDGAQCDLGSECKSATCIAETCATPPLLLGQNCSGPVDCDSEFCNYESTRVCDELPLRLGKPCVVGAECDTGVCFQSECTQGLPVGSDCADADQPPCDPKSAFCDTIDSDEPVCAALFETGDTCEAAIQCRGDCVIQRGRLVCSPAAAEGEAICGGGPTSRSDDGDEETGEEADSQASEEE